MFLQTTAKILIIDKDEAFCKLLRDYLEDSGFTVIQSSNGEDGLKLFTNENPDAILCDLDLPKMSGLEVLEYFTHYFPELPALIVSEPKSMDQIIQALRLGAWDYVAKPLKDLAVLEHSICKCLERVRLVNENKQYRIEIEAANIALKKSLATLEADQEAGRSVQLKLLPPQGLSFGNYCFTHKVLPSLYLSGDFIDYFKINDKQLGFYIADVSGHGASSAFVTVLLKSLMNKFLSHYQANTDTLILDPEKVLSVLSSEIHGSQLGKYLTMIYGIIDQTDNTLTYSIGGHYPNPILLENGQARFLEGKGFPVGIMKKAHYQNITIPYPPNSQISLFSDGIMEIVPAPDMITKETWLLECVQKTKADIEKIVKSLQLSDDKELPDDITLLILNNAL
ncbi:MAG: putative response regulator [Francisellaceae bacterium]|nr:putative response regulator [Francisellaceae bacterium]